MGSGKWVGHDPSGAGWPGVWLVAGYPPRTAGTMAPGRPTVRPVDDVPRRAATCRDVPRRAAGAAGPRAMHYVMHYGMHYVMQTRRDVPRRAATCRDVPRRAATCRDVPRRAATRRDAPRRAAVCRGVVQRGPCRHSELLPYQSGPSYLKCPLVHFRENSELLRSKALSLASAGLLRCEPYPMHRGA